MQKFNTDILIIGGGIAGLWTMNILQQRGYSVVLCEKNALGSEQTIKSQGIIHGGLKYALSGITNRASRALTDMPTRWRNCLLGNGEIDLRQVEVLADSQYMWSTNKFGGSLTALFASKAMQTHVSIESNLPSVLQESKINTKLYKLSEVVLNVPSLINTLAHKHADKCLQLEYNESVPITAQKYIYVSGTGNAIHYNNAQLRPLHMVMVKSNKLGPLFGHCIAMGTTPRITITTHTAKDGTPVWYLGGKIAEDGIQIESEQQIKNAQQELQDIFPNLDLQDAKWASFFVDRAEAKGKKGAKPDTATIVSEGNKIIAWPTKLALAPILTDQIVETLHKENITPLHPQPNLSAYPKAKVATPIWDQLL